MKKNSILWNVVGVAAGVVVYKLLLDTVDLACDLIEMRMDKVAEKRRNALIERDIAKSVDHCGNVMMIDHLFRKDDEPKTVEPTEDDAFMSMTDEDDELAHC